METQQNSRIHLSPPRPALRLDGWSLAALAIVSVVVAPLLAVVWIAFHPTENIWPHLMATVLPRYFTTTLVMMLGVGVLTAAMGTGAAWLVTMYRFAGRGWLVHALLFPLALPAYVGAYALVDFLDYSGPLQTALRLGFGWQDSRDYWFPEIRSTWAAILVLSAALYPYVYLLTRQALREQSGGIYEVARALGTGGWGLFWRLGLPLARPAIAAGVALALMETLADYGTVSYFAVQTFTTGIYRAWFSLGDRVAAAQLAMCLLGFVVLLLALERQSRGSARFHGSGLRRHPTRGAPLTGLHATVAIGACVLPVLIGFVLPGGVLLHMALTEGDAQFGARFFTLARNSIVVSGLTALLAVALALLVAYARRLDPRPLTRAAHWAVGLGYALPGSVIAVGVLIPVARLDNALAQALLVNFGWNTGLLFTGTIAALVFACLVRFMTAALQTIDSALHRVTPHMDDAARSLGLTPARTLQRVHLPLLRRGLLTAGLLVFIDVMKELPATLVMRPFNFDTLATQAYTLASDERLAEASTATIAIVAVGLLPLIVLCRQIARERQ